MAATQMQRRALFDGSAKFRQLRRAARVAQWTFEQDGTVVRIPLEFGISAVISVEDFPLVSQYVWNVARPKTANTFYAQASVPGGGNRKVLLHRLIAGPNGPEVDHRDRNGLNCVRENLRHCTGSQNCANRPSSRKRLLYRGVAILPSGHFRASIHVNRKQRSLGTFNTAEAAGLAYNVAAIEAFGEFATLNVIGDGNGHGE